MMSETRIPFKSARLLRKIIKRRLQEDILDQIIMSTGRAAIVVLIE